MLDCHDNKSIVDDCPVKGWKRIICRRKRGKTAGKLDVYYVNIEGKKLRSKPDVSRYLKLTSLDLPLSLFKFRGSECVSKQARPKQCVSSEYFRNVNNDTEIDKSGEVSSELQIGRPSVNIACDGIFSNNTQIGNYGKYNDPHEPDRDTDGLTQSEKINSNHTIESIASTSNELETTVHAIPKTIDISKSTIYTKMKSTVKSPTVRNLVNTNTSKEPGPVVKSVTPITKYMFGITIPETGLTSHSDQVTIAGSLSVEKHVDNVIPDKQAGTNNTQHTDTVSCIEPVETSLTCYPNVPNTAGTEVDIITNNLAQELPSTTSNRECDGTLHCIIQNVSPSNKPSSKLTRKKQQSTKKKKLTTSLYFKPKNLLNNFNFSKKSVDKMCPGLTKFYQLKYIPPESPFNLIQEQLYKEPWKLLVATIFLNRTNNRNAIPILWKFFEMLPNAVKTSKADPDEIAKIIQPLGLYRKRSYILVRFSVEYLTKMWHYPIELYGIGKYGNDSFRIFCLGEYQDVFPDDHKLNLYHNWICERDRECSMSSS